MRRTAQGLTLLELMTTIAVLAIGLGIGAPALRTLHERAKVWQAIHVTTAALATARIEAVRRNRPVSVCPSRDGQRCRTDLVWDVGSLVFIDSARTGQPRSADDVLQVIDGIGEDISMRATSGRRLVRFNPNGWSAGSNVTLRLCNGSGRHLAQIVVNNAGRVRSERLDDTPACPF